MKFGYLYSIVDSKLNFNKIKKLDPIEVKMVKEAEFYVDKMTDEQIDTIREIDISQSWPN